MSACKAIARFTGDHTFERYSESEITTSAMERKFEIVGEALVRLRNVDPGVFERIHDADRSLDSGTGSFTATMPSITGSSGTSSRTSCPSSRRKSSSYSTKETTMRDTLPSIGVRTPRRHGHQRNVDGHRAASAAIARDTPATLGRDRPRAGRSGDRARSNRRRIGCRRRTPSGALGRRGREGAQGGVNAEPGAIREARGIETAVRAPAEPSCGRGLRDAVPDARHEQERPRMRSSSSSSPL
jgi:hypothetical protein